MLRYKDATYIKNNCNAYNVEYNGQMYIANAFDNISYYVSQL